MTWLVHFQPPNPSPSDVLEHYGSFVSELWEMGTTGVAEATLPGAEPGQGGLVAGFEQRQQAEAAADAGRAISLTAVVSTPDSSLWSVDEVSTIDLAGPDGLIQFQLTAATAFGHGAHPTTRLVLDLMSQQHLNGRAVLDVGTGSGVLAIAAGLLGADSIVAIDIDAEAVAVAVANAALNHVAIEPIIGQAEQLTNSGRRFDLIVANMLVGAHETSAAAIGRLAADAAVLVLSGYLHDQAGRVLAAYQSAMPDLKVTAGLSNNGWRGEVLTRQPSPSTAEVNG